MRLIAADNTQLGIVAFSEAIEKATGAGLDLVLVAEDGEPPVCRMMNYGKKQYERKRRVKDHKKKRPVGHKVKEIKFHTNIDPHDYRTKLNRIVDFLGKGYRVKVSLFLRGREVTHKEIAKDLMEKVVADTAEAGALDIAPREVGRNITLYLSPKPGKGA